MKKKLLITVALVITLAICVSVYFLGYSNHKNTDSIPPLATIAEMNEAEVNKILSGYYIEQLKEVWGEPESSNANTDQWKINDKILLVSYKSKGLVVTCALKDAMGKSAGS